MQIGLWIDDSGLSIDQLGERLRAAAGAGFTTAWLGERLGWDPLTVLAAVGPRAAGIQLGTAIVRSYPRHPLALATQALSTQAAVGGRLVLGVGPSHAPIIEQQYGYRFTAPVRNFREYLSILRAALRGEEVACRGEFWSATGQVPVPGAVPPRVLVSALGPAMLRLAGELADGTLLTWLNPPAIADYVRPAMAKAAAAAGRAVPQVVAGVCVCVTSDEDAARRWLDDTYGVATTLDSYRAVLDRQGLTRVSQTAVVGDEASVTRQLRRFADAGVDELQVILVGSAADMARTLRLLEGVKPPPR